MKNPKEVFDGLWATMGEPTMTDEEAVKVVGKLWRFGGGKSAGDVTTNVRVDGVRRDVNEFLHVNPRSGWKKIVFGTAWLISCDIGDGYTDTFSAYSWAVRMTRELIRRKWLSGNLRPQPKPAPTKRDTVVAHIKRIEKLEQGWRTKQKRAGNALKKLKVKRKYYEKRLSECGP